MNTKCAFISIVGCPNVGKSSLLNTVLGEKLAIVTNKPQTTRTKITGVLTLDEKQYVFIDTPGLHSAKTKLGDNMTKAAHASLNDIDLVLFVVEPHLKINEIQLQLIENLKQKRLPCILVINKIDLVGDKAKLIPVIEKFTALHNFEAVLPISVEKKDGIDVLMREVDKFLVDSVHFFPEDSLTDQPERVIIAERLREKILVNMHMEIPHGTAVVVEKVHARENKDIIDIEATIYCERKTHKGMIIGKNGAVLKRISSQARHDIESFLDMQVNLKCWVKVKEDWRNKDGFIDNFGLSFKN